MNSIIVLTQIFKTCLNKFFSNKKCLNFYFLTSFYYTTQKVTFEMLHPDLSSPRLLPSSAPPRPRDRLLGTRALGRLPHSPTHLPPPASRLPPRSWPLPAPLALSSSLLSAQHSAALDLPASSASSDYRLWRSPLCLLRLARPSPPPTTKCYRGTYLRRCSCTLIDFWH